MSKEESSKISLMKRIALDKRYLLIAQVAEKYANDKSVLRAMKKIAHKECKGLRDSRYPMEAMDVQEALVSIKELYDILCSLIKRSGYERYRLASGMLVEFIVKLEGKIKDDECAMRTKPSVQESLGAAIDKAKEIGEAIGKGVEGIKKTVKDLGSK